MGRRRLQWLWKIFSWYEKLSVGMIKLQWVDEGDRGNERVVMGMRILSF